MREGRRGGRESVSEDGGPHAISALVRRNSPHPRTRHPTQTMTSKYLLLSISLLLRGLPSVTRKTRYSLITFVLCYTKHKLFHLAHREH